MCFNFSMVHVLSVSFMLHVHHHESQASGLCLFDWLRFIVVSSCCSISTSRRRRSSTHRGTGTQSTHRRREFIYLQFFKQSLFQQHWCLRFYGNCKTLFTWTLEIALFYLFIKLLVNLLLLRLTFRWTAAAWEQLKLEPWSRDLRRGTKKLKTGKEKCWECRQH